MHRDPKLQFNNNDAGIEMSFNIPNDYFKLTGISFL